VGVVFLCRHSRIGPWAWLFYVVSLRFVLGLSVVILCSRSRIGLWAVVLLSHSRICPWA
jgi:hypothetical protein